MDRLLITIRLEGRNVTVDLTDLVVEWGTADNTLPEGEDTVNNDLPDAEGEPEQLPGAPIAPEQQ